MSYTKAQIHEVIRLCNQVSNLASQTLAEGEEVQVWDSSQQKLVARPSWPYYGGTKTTGAFRRKSMDLTRALADLRKP